MANMTAYLGNATFFIPLFILGNSVSLVSIIVCRLTGPNELVSSLNLFVPIVLAIGMAILVFFSKTFWATWMCYGILWLVSAILSFYALELSLEDKSGMGVTMASGFVGMMCFGGAAMLKGLLVIYVKLTS